MSNPVIIGNATLYLGDCLEILPTLGPVDGAVADPPYGMAELFQGGGWAKQSAFVRNNDAGWDQINQKAVDSLIDLHIPTIIWGGNHYAVPPRRGWLVWEKDGAGTAFTLGHGELAWTNLDIPIRFFYHARHKATGANAPVHGTAKPLPLMEWCLRFLPDAQTILDPFMGSGTTGVACAKMGRKFIGIEIEPKYFDIACKRIEEAQRQADLFIPMTQQERSKDATANYELAIETVRKS